MANVFTLLFEQQNFVTANEPRPFAGWKHVEEINNTNNQTSDYEAQVRTGSAHTSLDIRGFLRVIM